MGGKKRGDRVTVERLNKQETRLENQKKVQEKNGSVETGDDDVEGM